MTLIYNFNFINHGRHPVRQNLAFRDPSRTQKYTHPRVAAMHRSIERSYLHDAEREDTDAKAHRRLIL
jgi:hypothetical protein